MPLSDDRLLSLIDLARHAPSVLNTQPWRFRLIDDGIEVFADRSRQLHALDPEGRELTLSCGAALAALRLAAAHDGLRAHLALLPDDGAPDLLARVTFEPAPPPDNDRLLRALRTRRTHRRDFAPDPIPRNDMEALAEAVTSNGAWLHLLTVPGSRATVADLVDEAVRVQGQSKAVVDEIKTWLRRDRDPRPDGVRDGDQGRWDRVAAVRTSAAAVAVHKAAGLREAPAIAILGTDEDDEAAWLRAGLALGDMLVAASDRGLAVSYANEPIEVGGVYRRRLAALLGETHPQVLLRLGRPIAEVEVPRRPLRDIVERTDAPPPSDTPPRGPGPSRLPRSTAA